MCNEKLLPQRLIEFNNYLKKNKNKSDNTIISYTNDLIQLLRFIKNSKNKIKKDIEDIKYVDISHITDKFLKSIKKQDLYDFISYLTDINESSNSKARKISSIKQFFKYLTKTIDMLNENISLFLETPEKEERSPIFLNLQEQKELFNAIKKHSNDENYIKDYTIIALLLTTGMRVSEISNLNINSLNIEYNNNYIHVIGKGNKERPVDIPQQTFDGIMIPYLEDRKTILVNPKYKDALFINRCHNRMTPENIRAMLRKYMNQTDIQKHVTPHKLRHSAATNMVDADTPITSIQKVLGHTRVSTTEIYTHVHDKKVKEAINNNPVNDLISL